MIPQAPPSPPAPVPIRFSKLLLVEGSTPLHFFEALLRHLGLQDEIEIRDFGGIHELAGKLKALTLTADFRSLVTSVGVTRDAEDDARAASAAVQHAMISAGLTPERMPQVQTSYFIFPDGQSPGMIETLCIESVKDDPGYHCVEEFFDCVRAENVKLPEGVVFAKSQVQAYLATRRDVQLFPGIAAYRDYWPWDSPALDRLKEFLKSL